MKSFNPSISNPMSRSKKRGSISPTLFVGIAFLGAVIFGVFYLTVYQGMIQHTKLKLRDDELLNGVPHPALGHLERHHAMGNFGGIGEKAFRSYHGKLILHLTEFDADIIIHTRADWSPESVAYVHDIAKNADAGGDCDRCAFYRAEKPGILQGMIVSNSLPKVTQKGDCPAEYLEAHQDCPTHDPKCACHGPIMTKGMVGWAGGGTGTDFFINTYDKPANFWGNQHTVWGKITDEDSLALITKIFEKPVTAKGDMHYFDSNIKFTMSVES